VLAAVLGVALVLPFPIGAQDVSPPAEVVEQQTPAEEPWLSEEEKTPAGLAQEGEASQRDEKSEEESDEDEPGDAAPDSHRDPIISKFVKRRVLIDRPRFSAETGGKIQVQYFDADSDDPDNEDDVFLRRLRPFFLGHLATNWKWKLEIELSADIEARNIRLDQLDIRDAYLRYEGRKTRGRRLTFGNQRAPFSRDLLTPSTHQLLVERSFVGDSSGGVPTRTLGVHLRGESTAGRVAYWGSVGALGHDPDAHRMKFESLIGGSDDLNEGVLVAGRLDLHPRGSMTFSDGDSHTPRFKYTWSLAGYVWENNGNINRLTEGGVSLDPERADLDSASGLELSGGLRGRGITLDWQYNRIRGETVANDFSGGLYVGGDTHLDVFAVEGGYRFSRSPVELGGELSRFEADGYADAMDRATLVLNLHGLDRFNAKLQISHGWMSSRGGVPGDDFQETRIQLQYFW